MYFFPFPILYISNWPSGISLLQPEVHDVEFSQWRSADGKLSFPTPLENIYFSLILNCCLFWHKILYCPLFFHSNWRYYFLGFWLSLLCLEDWFIWLLSAFEIICLCLPQFLLSFRFLTFSWSFLLYYSLVIFFTPFIFLNEVSVGLILLSVVSAGFYFWCFVSLDVLWFLSVNSYFLELGECFEA